MKKDAFSCFLAKLLCIISVFEIFSCLSFAQIETYTISSSSKKITDNFILGFGLEAFTESFESHLSNYVLESRRKNTQRTKIASHFTNTPIHGFSDALGGCDVEVGTHIPFPWWHSLVIRLCAGGYHLQRSRADSVLGPKGRLELLVQNLLVPGDRMTLGGEVIHNNPRGIQQFFHFGFRIPFQHKFQHKDRKSSPRPSLEDRFTDKVIKDIDAVAMISHKLSTKKKLPPLTLREKIKEGLKTNTPSLRIPENLDKTPLKKPEASNHPTP